MSKVTVIDKLPLFGSHNDKIMDAALAEMSTDIIRLARPSTPYFQGLLRASARFQRIRAKKYKTGYYKEYARRLEFGDGFAFKTAGTKAHYLRDAGRQVAMNAKNYLLKHGQRGLRQFGGGL